MLARISVLVAIVVLGLALQNVEGLTKIKDCETEKTMQNPRICIENPDVHGHANLNRSEIHNRLLLLQNETSVHCGSTITQIKFYLYVMDVAAPETHNASSRSVVDDLVLEQNDNCSSYGVLFVTDNSTSITIGRNAGELLNEAKINGDLQSLKQPANIEERVFDAIDVLKSAIANATPRTSEAGGQTWVIFVGLGFVAMILVAMVYWIWNRSKHRRGMVPVPTSERHE